MTLIRSISGIQGIISGSADEGLSPLDVAGFLAVIEKYSKEQNAGQSLRNVLPLHSDTLTLYVLAYACPHIDRKGDCPLKVIEKLPFKQKVLWINRLSKEEKGIILEHHKAYSKNR
jgi:hypothetical protein